MVATSVCIVPLINFHGKIGKDNDDAGSGCLPASARVVSLSLASLAAWFEIPNIRRLFLALLDLDLRWWDSIKSFCINGTSLEESRFTFLSLRNSIILCEQLFCMLRVKYAVGRWTQMYKRKNRILNRQNYFYSRVICRNTRDAFKNKKSKRT